jgi:ABC-type multidrug transport system permease subunit
MTRAWHITTKELLQTSRDRLAALFTLVLPVVMTIFLGLLIGTADDPRVPLAVADLDGTPASRQLLSRLDASPLLEVDTMAAADIDAAVLGREAAAGLIIPAGFEAALADNRQTELAFVRIETVSGAQTAWEAVQAAVSRTNVVLLATDTAAEAVADATGSPLDAGLRESVRGPVEAALAQPAATVAVIEAGRSSQVEASGFAQSSPGGLVNWVLFGLLTVTTGVAWERRQGLLRRLSSTGVSNREIVNGKVLAMVIITFLQQLLLVILGQAAFGVDYFSSPAALILTMLSLSVLAASLGLLISSVFRSEQAIIATTVITAQLLAALGGAWFPLEVTSASFARVAHFLPTAWIMDCFHGITLSDWGLAEVLRPLGIVWIWIVVVFSLAVWRFRPE